jgi:hypothetical protein
MSPSPLRFSLGEWKGLAMERKRILAQTLNVVAKYWEKGGIWKWVEFLCSHDFFLTWDPNPFFYRPEEIVIVGVTRYG